LTAEEARRGNQYAEQVQVLDAAMIIALYSTKGALREDHAAGVPCGLLVAQAQHRACRRRFRRRSARVVQHDALSVRLSRYLDEIGKTIDKLGEGIRAGGRGYGRLQTQRTLMRSPCRLRLIPCKPSPLDVREAVAAVELCARSRIEGAQAPRAPHGCADMAQRTAITAQIGDCVNPDCRSERADRAAGGFRGNAAGRFSR